MPETPNPTLTNGYIFDPSLTMERNMAQAQAAGHTCCACPNQTPPLPCCNAGHEEAVGTAADFAAVTDE